MIDLLVSDYKSGNGHISKKPYTINNETKFEF